MLCNLLSKKVFIKIHFIKHKANRMPTANDDKKSNNNLLFKYAGLATQLMVSLGLGVFLGLKADKWLAFKTPIFVWVLPLLILVTIIWQIIRETSKK